MKRYNDFFGTYGGRYVAEMLRPPLDELEAAFCDAIASPDFIQELEEILRDFAGRPTPLLFARNATRHLGGARIYIKMEGLAHTGAHKINNAVGQALLARRMARRASSLKPARGSTGLPPLPCAPGWASPAASTWARWTCGVSAPMCSGWNAMAPRWFR
jgi:tryptophan synthase beta chain